MNAWLLKKSERPAPVTIDLSDLDHLSLGHRIRCPICRWQPHASSRWVCWSGPGPEPPFDACGTAWNTFDTAGRCPGCTHQWEWTTCLSCGEWSRHVDWYEEVPGEH